MTTITRVCNVSTLMCNHLQLLIENWRKQSHNHWSTTDCSSTGSRAGHACSNHTDQHHPQLSQEQGRQTNSTKNEGILKSKKYYNQNKAENLGISLALQYLRLHTPNTGSSGLIPGQGAGSCMLQLRVCMLQLKIPHATTKTENSTWPNT